MTLLHTSCPLCEGSFLNDRFIVNGFTICRCRGCRLVFVREILSDADLAAHYSPDAIYFDAENEENLRFYDRNLKALIEARHSRGSILDVGCERGRFLDSMENWERHGIEIYGPQAEAARKRYGSNIHQGTLEDYPDRGRRFDVITILDALDHMPRPLEALRRCRELLKPDGLIVVKVHDISCIYARLMGSKFYAITPPAHLFYFDGRSLALAFRRAGLEFQGGRHFPHRLFLKTIPYRLSRGRGSGLAAALSRRLSASRLGTLTIRKNLHDVITVFGTKRAGENEESRRAGRLDAQEHSSE